MKRATMILKVVFSLLLWAACLGQGGVLGCREGWYDATTVDTGQLPTRKKDKISQKILKYKRTRSGNVLETFERLRLVFHFWLDNEKN
jgi:hypothetical protein